MKIVYTCKSFHVNETMCLNCVEIPTMTIMNKVVNKTFEKAS